MPSAPANRTPHIPDTAPAAPGCDCARAPGTSRSRRRRHQIRTPRPTPAVQARAAPGRWRTAERTSFKYRTIEMAERAAAFANRQRVLDGAGDILLRASRRLFERASQRKVGRDGGGERAAGAVRVRRVDARRAKFREVMAVKEYVDDLVRVTGVMAARDEHRGAADVVNPARRLPEIGLRLNPLSAEHLGFRHVRRDDARQRDQLR